jgi:hypothetical protein
MPPMLPRPLAFGLVARLPDTALLGAGFLASFVLFVRVLSAAAFEGWSGATAALLVAVAAAAFTLHSWTIATGRGWRHSLEGVDRAERLQRLEALVAQGRIRRAEYLEERAKVLRRP